ncbi:MAG TPA: hypothetical protein VEX13_00670 [Chloroflexia bacterium]|nr:hypothetical protein [Chloroflexia bacterium]
MQLTIPLILIALGGAGLVAIRNTRMVMGALAVQWLGAVWVAFLLSPSETALSVAAVEAVAAVVCLAMLGTTLLHLQRLKVEQQAQSEARALPSPYEVAWLAAIVLTGGVVGVSLAALYPLGAVEGSMVAVYWVFLSGVLALVVEGSRSPVKLAAGLLALLNGTLLLTLAASPTLPGPVMLGLMSLTRIAVAGIMAYGWMLLKVVFLDLNLNILFDSRSNLSTETALVVQGSGVGDQGSDVENQGSEIVSEDTEPEPVDLAEDVGEDSATDIETAGEEPQSSE